MQDYKTWLDKLRRDADEAAIVRDRAVDPAKQALYHWLYQHYMSLAAEVAKAIEAQEHEAPPGVLPS